MLMTMDSATTQLNRNIKTENTWIYKCVSNDQARYLTSMPDYYMVI